MRDDETVEKPPFISMADAGSFARYTLDARFPRIIDSVMALRSGREEAELAALRARIPGGRISDPFEKDGCPAAGYDPAAFDTEELAAWRGEIAKYSSLDWTRIPFYFAESYLYLRILLACGYYDKASRYFQKDPYENVKEDELDHFLASEGMENMAAAFTQTPRSHAQDMFAPALLFMLKANRIDLSNTEVARLGRQLILSSSRDDLIVDHTDCLARRVGASRRLHIILDNAGAELAADLIFTWLYLASDPARQIVLHAKKAPTFVSDALRKDIYKTAAKLKSRPSLKSIGTDIETFIAQGRLRPADHHFWNGPQHFPDMPEELRQDIARADITLLKGDANFRRMTEDRHWPLSTNLEKLTSWFPGTYAILRTLKSETATDIPEELSSRLTQTDPHWLTNGRWGFVRLVPHLAPYTE
jgi:uncharacterized protein with ATP-grasp and redox domains